MLCSVGGSGRVVPVVIIIVLAGVLLAGLDRREHAAMCRGHHLLLLLLRRSILHWELKWFIARQYQRNLLLLLRVVLFEPR